MPVYNEIEHLEQLAMEILGQDYPALSEIWFVDGQSQDGTLEALHRIQDRDRRIRVITNPQRSPAAAVNLALKHLNADVVMRLDAHARYHSDVVSQSVQALLATGAGGAGAIARPVDAKTLIGRAIVTAHRSRLGVGVAQFRREGAEGWVDSVWNGCYWRHVVDQVGPLREDLWRAEDNDFNARIRLLGYGLYLSPKIRAFYQPRTSLRALWTQYLGNGAGIIRALFENRRAISLRHLMPMALVVSLVVPLVLGLMWPPALWISAGVFVLYAMALIGGTLLAAHTERGAHLILLPIVLMTLHVSYGVGSVWGIASKIRRRPIQNVGKTKAL